VHLVGLAIEIDATLVTVLIYCNIIIKKCDISYAEHSVY